ncbi:hypothetical protein [Natrinema longum]|uniref:Uncharacterized protein n=1 Tax=Natrinema longum TaxID=370324 RepID=A0A8A2UBV7_9EURY|nr:hypothetical protein [Natrinema longum]MBZ6495980.1 hypothetical protein [Natrinema longum]QSW86084.1 hypothetical protein J0X27_04465 [Natrinema longum]
MVEIDTDTETEPELGTATIVYELPGEDVERVTVDNDRIAYFQDHWLFAYGTDEDGNDVVRRVPKARVHFVERSVEEVTETFESGLEKAKAKLEELRD